MMYRNWLRMAVVSGLSAGFVVAAAAQQNSVDGTVEKIDKSAGKITLKHGPIKNLDMDGMTMVFRVQDPAMLTQVQVGSKVRFIAEKVGGALTVTTLEVQ